MDKQIIADRLCRLYNLMKDNTRYYIETESGATLTLFKVSVEGWIKDLNRVDVESIVSIMKCANLLYRNIIPPEFRRNGHWI